MRRLLLLLVACGLTYATAQWSHAAENAAQAGADKVQTPPTSAWQVGYAQADITPPRGHTLMAGFGEERYAEGTLAPLRAQALVFQDERGHRAVLYAADVLGFSPETVAIVRHELQQAHGIEPQAVCMAASHTHWGPGINYRMNFLAGGLNVWYLLFLEDTLVRLAEQAIHDLGPAQLSYAECAVQIGMCRRTVEPDGGVAWAPDPAGSYDRHTPVLKIIRQKSPKNLVIVGHACHPTSSALDLKKWWPDYPGAMRERLESRLADCRALFVMGCGGDAKVVYKNPQTDKYEFSQSQETCKEAGEKLADAVLKRLKEGELRSLSGQLQATSARGSLSFAEPPPRTRLVEMANDRKSTLGSTWARQSLEYPDNRKQLDYEVQVWRLGPLTLVALEGEVCSDWGGITRGMASAPVMVVAYANRCQGYIPTARIVREGGYEGDGAHMVYLLPAPFQQKVEPELKSLISRALDRMGRQ